MPHSNEDPESLNSAFLRQSPEGKDAPPGTSSLEERIARIEARLRREVDPSIALERDLIDLGQVPSCGIHKTGDQTIGDNAFEEVTFGTTTWDTDQMADLDNNGITIRRVGIYLVTFNLRFVNATTGSRKSFAQVNDNEIFMGAGQGAIGGNNPRLSCATPRYFEIGDTITAQVFQDSGGDLALTGSTASSSGPQLTATLISDTGDIRTEMA